MAFFTYPNLAYFFLKGSLLISHKHETFSALGQSTARLWSLGVWPTTECTPNRRLNKYFDRNKSIWAPDPGDTPLKIATAPDISPAEIPTNQLGGDTQIINTLLGVPSFNLSTPPVLSASMFQAPANQIETGDWQTTNPLPNIESTLETAAVVPQPILASISYWKPIRYCRCGLSPNNDRFSALGMGTRHILDSFYRCCQTARSGYVGTLSTQGWHSRFHHEFCTANGQTQDSAGNRSCEPECEMCTWKLKKRSSQVQEWMGGVIFDPWTISDLGKSNRLDLFFLANLQESRLFLFHQNTKIPRTPFFFSFSFSAKPLTSDRRHNTLFFWVASPYHMIMWGGFLCV